MTITPKSLAIIRRYGETKRGHDALHILTGRDRVGIVATDGTRHRSIEVTFSHLRLLADDEITAGLCDVIDTVLHDLRDARKRDG